jgi:hypothetical protein
MWNASQEQHEGPDAESGTVTRAEGNRIDSRAPFGL